MGTSYPGGQDSFQRANPNDPLNGPSHAGQHDNAYDAIEAIETELGTNPSGSDATVAARLTAIEAGTNLATGAVTSAKIADGTITATDVAAGTFAAFSTVGNLLTANQASGGDTLGDTTGFVDSGHETTRIYITSDSKNGAGCIKTTLVGASSPLTDLSGAFACTPGETVTFLVALKVAATSGKARANLRFKLADNSYVYVEGTNLTGSAWGWATVTSVAPATAVSVSGYIYAYDFAPGEYYLLDSPSIHKGVGGDWAMPGTPITGLSEVATNGAVHLSGTGSPEGVVTAAPGSTWLQTDSTTDVKGWIKWVKATGTGNTGWVAGPEADTGLRNVSAALVTGANVTLSYTFLQRTGNRVDVSFRAMYSGGAVGAPVALFELPPGFRPVTVGIRDFVIADDGATPASVRQGFLRSYVFQVYNPTPNATYNGMFTIATPDAWPTSLPGSAA